MLLKVMHQREGFPGDDREHSLYADIASCHFHRHEDGSCTAKLWVREPVKTALVQGFCEDAVHIDLPGVAYLMNDNGRTVSTFMP